MRDTIVRANDKVSGDEIEQLRMKYSQTETMVGMGIVAVMAIGGLVCMAAGIAGGQQIVSAVLGLVGWLRNKRNEDNPSPALIPAHFGMRNSITLLAIFDRSSCTTRRL